MPNRPAGVFTLFAIIFVVLLGFYGRALSLFISAKWDVRNSPEIWMTPQPLAAPPPPSPSVPKLTYFGYEFESPTIEVQESKNFDSGVVLTFSDCAGVMILKPQPGGILLAAMRASGKESDIQTVFGMEATSTDYALRSTTLNLTPRALTLAASPARISGTAVLLTIKHIGAQRFKNGLYTFTTPWMRGFQEGDTLRDRGVLVEAFDDQDRKLTLIVAHKPGKSCFSQTQLNQIIFSLRPVPAS